MPAKPKSARKSNGLSLVEPVDSAVADELDPSAETLATLAVGDEGGEETLPRRPRTVMRHDPATIRHVFESGEYPYRTRLRPSVYETHMLGLQRELLKAQRWVERTGQRVVVLDDLLATGGTMAAGIQLLRNVGAAVPAAAALIELTFLNGRRRLDVPCEVLVSYDS